MNVSKFGEEIKMSIPGFFEGLSWSFFRDLEDKVIASTKYVELV
jgi:shikimate kinase